MTSGFCLVLHAHMPYVRRHGAWPCGEDWYHQAAAECYLPLAAAFERLAAEGLRGLASVSITPALAAQMADPYMTRELALYLGRVQLRAERQVTNYRGPFRDEMADVAAFYHRRAAAMTEEVSTRWRAGLHDAWAGLAVAGTVEMLTAPPAHAFLPLIRDEGLVLGQLRASVSEHARLFGVAPAGAWLPECGYRPARNGSGGIEDLLERAGLRYFVVDEPAFERAGASIRRPVRVGRASVAAFARDREASSLVAGGPASGYPAGPWYRDFHHHDGEAGFKSFRVTDPSAPVAGKLPYDPDRARAAVTRDAERFAAEVEARLERDRAATGREGVLVACFDAELFGHWWFEGPAFLEALLRALSASGTVRPMTLSEALDRFPPEGRVWLPESSWGRGHDASNWLNAANEPFWRRVWSAEERVREALASGVDGRLVAQALRELLLLSASDWPFMITTGRAGDYARGRVEEHDRALSRLCEAAVAGREVADLAEIEERDRLLPALDPEDFR